MVTIENFLSWKAKFELEMAELRRKRQKEEEQAGKPKLTGEPDSSLSHLIQKVGARRGEGQVDRPLVLL